MDLTYNAAITVPDPHPTEAHIRVHPNPCATMLLEELFSGIPNFPLGKCLQCSIDDGEILGSWHEYPAME